jgi:RNA polymerase sigma factor (sigma-70 family)
VRKNSVALVNTSRSTSGNRANESSTNSESSISTVHILERAQRGDRAALHALIDRAMPPVRRWARGRLPQYARQDANTEDVVQDAVLGTIKNIKRLRRVTLGGVQAYLRQSVVNRIRDLIRGKKRRGIVIELDENLPDNRLSPLEAAIRRERHDRFLDALRRLSPTDRQVIVWRLELGYSVEEIAPRLGKSNAAAGMTVTRAVARLATQLDLARS